MRPKRHLRDRFAPAALALALALGTAVPALAYVGPGAGFALVSGFLVIFTTIILASLSLLILPFRMLWRFVRRRRTGKPLIRRFIVVGLDGQDPRITDQLMQAGKLPNFQRLAEMGSYRRLRTVYPSLSPVAWSSFGTGTNPGGHNVFDFVERDPRNYMPRQASVEIGKLEKTMKLGSFRIPLHKPVLRLLRKSKPFWTILGEHDIWSTVLRVPITFPPDRFYGAQLGAMAIPDLLGTQGTFYLFTTRPADTSFKEGGLRVALTGGPVRYTASVAGPENS
ncbi:MAG: alkaline phosphatase family protein, partial [Thermoanaerobaculia bacterium]|nr:alkaline phosphatase family protein [Thermoanaerobaculia bacterium]